MPATKRTYRKRLAEEEEDSSQPDTPRSAPSGEAEGGEQEEEDVSALVQEALELRKYRRRLAGIEAGELIKGDKKKKKEEKKGDDDPWKLKSGGGLIELNDVRGRQFGGAEDSNLSTASFAQASNAMDTERHMREYVERDLKKKRGGTDQEVTEEDAANGKSVVSDYKDELFVIPDNLQISAKPVSEGNVTLSTSMLTAIPEIDLGIDVKLRNIEETERAKRRLHESSGPATIDSVIVAAERFWNGHRGQTQNRHAPGSPKRKPAEEKKAPARQPAPAPPANPILMKVNGPIEPKKRFDRNTMATDEMVMERFKKRIRRK